MNYNIATILAVIAILFVLITYITSAPLVRSQSSCSGWRLFSEDAEAEV